MDSLRRVAELCDRVAVLPLLAHEPVGAEALSDLTQLTPEGTLAHAQ